MTNDSTLASKVAALRKFLKTHREVIIKDEHYRPPMKDTSADEMAFIVEKSLLMFVELEEAGIPIRLSQKSGQQIIDKIAAYQALAQYYFSSATTAARTKRPANEVAKEIEVMVAESSKIRQTVIDYLSKLLKIAEKIA